MVPPSAISLYLTYFLALTGLVLDLKYKKIPAFLLWIFISFSLTFVSLRGGWNELNHSPIDFLKGQSPLCLYQSFLNAFLVFLLFGLATWKKSFGQSDFLLLISLALINHLGPFLNLLIAIALAGFGLACAMLIRRKLFGQAIKASINYLTLRGRLRNEDGTLAPVHEIAIPYTPAIALGVLLSGGGWGW